MGNLNDKVIPKGAVVITIRDKDGKVVRVIRDNNLVVDVGRTACAELLGGLNQSDKEVTQQGYGTDGTAPSAGDTTLTTLFKKALSGTTFPATGQVKFSSSLLTSEYNGNTIMEFGLFTFDDTLFARLTNPGIAKSAAIQIDIDWTITF